MAYAADFFDILKRPIDSVNPARSSLKDDVKHFFEDLLLHPDFDQIGRLDASGDEFNMYRELGALPEAYR